MEEGAFLLISVLLKTPTAGTKYIFDQRRLNSVALEDTVRYIRRSASTFVDVAQARSLSAWVWSPHE